MKYQTKYNRGDTLRIKKDADTDDAGKIFTVDTISISDYPEGIVVDYYAFDSEPSIGCSEEDVEVVIKKTEKVTFLEFEGERLEMK